VVTAVCAVAIWIALCVLVLTVPVFARAVGAAVIILIVVGLTLAFASPAGAAEITAHGADVTIVGSINHGDDERFTDVVTSSPKNAGGMCEVNHTLAWNHRASTRHAGCEMGCSQLMT
jgi:hypothetical protein